MNDDSRPTPPPSAGSFQARVNVLPPASAHGVTRVYPRLTIGGAEADILVLLEGIGDTHMVVTEVEGLAAERARTLAARYTKLQAPRFASLLAAMSRTSLVHLHTINDHPLAPLAAQLAGAPRIVQTVHNDFDCESSHFVDHSIVVAPETKWRIEAPSRSTCISSGILVPPAPLPRAPLGEPRRPLRLLEIRRPEKAMFVTLEQIVATGQLDDLPLEVTIVGIDGENGDPRVRRVGAVADPTPYLAEADIVVHGSAAETFGRVVFEALAQGALVAASPLPPFRRAASAGAALHLFQDLSPTGAAAGVRTLLRQLEAPAAWSTTRQRNHNYVRNHHGTQLMVARTRQVYAGVQGREPPPRNFLREDAEGDLGLFGATVDALLERRRPPALFAGMLSPRQQATLLWISARHGLLRRALVPAALERALAVLGPRHLLLLDLAKHLVAGGDVRGALPFLAGAVELDPDKVSPYLGLVTLHLALRQTEPARAWYERLGARWPEHPALAAIGQKLAGATTEPQGRG